MLKREKFLTPITPQPEAPAHTHILPRCFTCKHFDVCNLRTDYLKTAQLIENVLGRPCESDVKQCTCPHIPGFLGEKIENNKEYFPDTLTNEKDVEGKYVDARYETANLIHFLYDFNRYLVLFTATYNEETLLFDITGQEVYYRIPYTIKSDVELLQLGLATLKEDIEEFEEEAKKKEEELDIINTTHFYSTLECEYYEWEKGLSYDEAVRKLVCCHPNGIPIGENGELYHIATYHVEEGKVPLYHPENGLPVFVPTPYPVYIPPKKHRRPPMRRGDCCE